MTDKDLPEFKKLMAGLSEYFEKKLSKTVLELYWDGLKDFSIEEVKYAVNRAVKELTFFPKIKELYEFIQGSLDVKHLAEIAYNKLSEARRRYGAYQTVVFDDPIIHRIVEVHGGWPAVCQMSREEEKYIAFKKNFISEYEAFYQEKDRVTYSPKLPGLLEYENFRLGYFENIPPPVYVGNTRKILAWLEKNKRLAVEQEKKMKLAPEIEEKISNVLEMKAIGKTV